MGIQKVTLRVKMGNLGSPPPWRLQFWDFGGSGRSALALRLLLSTYAYYYHWVARPTELIDPCTFPVSSGLQL